MEIVWDRRQKIQIVEVDVSNKHVCSYATPFLKLFLVFLYAVSIFCARQSTDSLRAYFRLPKFNKRGDWNSDGGLEKFQEINHWEGAIIRCSSVPSGKNVILTPTPI